MKLTKSQNAFKIFKKKLNADIKLKKTEVGQLEKQILLEKGKLEKSSKVFEALKNKLSKTSNKKSNLKLKQFEIREITKKIIKTKKESNLLFDRITSKKEVKQKLVKQALKIEDKIEIIDLKLKKDELRINNLRKEKDAEEMIEIKSFEASLKLDEVKANETNLIADFNVSSISSQKSNQVLNLVLKEERQNADINLHKSWADNEKNLGMELEYKREDGRKFYFQIEKNKDNKINVNFMSNDLEKNELKKLEMLTKFNIVN